MTKMAAKMAVPTRYPRFIDMVTVSPPVSPSVVAAILMIQKASVTSGTLLKLDSGDCCGMRGLALFVAGVTRRYEWGIVPPTRSTIVEGCAIEEGLSNRVGSGVS